MAYARENNHNVEELKDSFGNVIHAAGTVASKVGSEMKKGAVEITGAVKDASQEAARQVGKTGEYVADVVSEQAQIATKKLDESVRHSPFISLAIAFGCGAAIALMCKRS